MSHLSYSGTSGSHSLEIKMQYLIVSKKKNRFLCEDEIESPVPKDHHLSLLSKPRDAKW